MLKHSAALFLIASLGAQLAAQTPKPSHHWAPLIRDTGVRVELDSATIIALDHQRRVWLRWTFPTAVADFASVQLEQRDVDCARPATRILATQDASTFDAVQATGPLVRSDTGAVWVRPSTGSLEAQVVTAVCG